MRLAGPLADHQLTSNTADGAKRRARTLCLWLQKHRMLPEAGSRSGLSQPGTAVHAGPAVL